LSIGQLPLATPAKILPIGQNHLLTRFEPHAGQGSVRAQPLSASDDRRESDEGRRRWDPGTRRRMLRNAWANRYGPHTLAANMHAPQRKKSAAIPTKANDPMPAKVIIADAQPTNSQHRLTGLFIINSKPTRLAASSERPVHITVKNERLICTSTLISRLAHGLPPWQGMGVPPRGNEGGPFSLSREAQTGVRACHIL
jgi:hypothetical protein